MDIMTINKDNFDKEVLQAEKPVRGESNTAKYLYRNLPLHNSHW